MKKIMAGRFFEELRHKYQLFQDLMDSIPDVIYFKDRSGRLIMVNRAHARGLGLKPEEVAGKSDFDFFPRERANKMAEDDELVMKTGKPIIDKIERATRPDGIDNYVSTTKIPRYDAEGKVIGLIGITRDITHRMQIRHLTDEKQYLKKKMEALEEINKLKSEFISAVSHELRTPLAIIKDAVGIVIDGLAGAVNDKQKELLARTNVNILRLQHIIAELLDIARIETGRLKLHCSLVNINDLIIDSSEFFKKLAVEKGVDLQYELPKNEINIFVDMERIIQVMNNLIGNAIKFTEGQGLVKIEVKAMEGKIRFGVIDTGVGIAKQDLARLFNKFTQVAKAAGALQKGVGLGLSIAKELINKHGGEIWVESRPGVGSKFYFTIPRLSAIDALGKNTRDNINKLLKDDKTVYLINLSIVNFREARKKIKIKPVKLTRDLKAIIETAFKGLTKAKVKNFEVLPAASKIGEYSILLSEATEANTAKVCELLKERLDNYFIQNRSENIFINIGKALYPREGESDLSAQLIGNFFVKKIYIGINKRSFKRVYYTMEIAVVFPPPENGIAAAQTIDISQGGICFLSGRALETDKQVGIKFKLPRLKKSLNVKGRVAWIRPMEGMSGAIDKYKVGVEFIGLKRKDKGNLVKFIKSIYT